MGWGVGFLKWPKKIRDFYVENQGEHWAYFYRNSDRKNVVQMWYFQPEKNSGGWAVQL